ncbi:Uncharacterized protein ESCO_004069 [Escovopsis weberi]|uniref:Uncharacterized protein n=1 Tax=Escovopsis weberi TaxID=150374 RepID=A0A0M9VVD3_ESCWE|nr:Uncharacterized protein ESCO_004069 [Escovopsis weberi]
MASHITRRFFSTTVRRLQQSPGREELAKEGKRDPEIVILGSLMVLALGGAGYYFGRSPTASTSQVDVAVAGLPWETDSSGKYKYHPGGDARQPAREAPSALNAVVVPNVTLPRELHDKYNKWGKEGYP